MGNPNARASKNTLSKASLAKAGLAQSLAEMNLGADEKKSGASDAGSTATSASNTKGPASVKSAGNTTRSTSVDSQGTAGGIRSASIGSQGTAAGGKVASTQAGERGPDVWHKHNYDMKEITINALGVHSNLIKHVRTHLPNGQAVETSGLAHPEGYNVVGEVEKLSPAAKAQFWENNYVAIEITLRTMQEEFEVTKQRKDLGEKYKEGKTAISVLRSLGREFTSGAKHIFVTIDFPRGMIQQIKLPEKIQGASHLDYRSPNLVTLMALVDVLENCTAIQRLNIQFRHPGPAAISPRNLLHAVPFYNLGFKDWKLQFLIHGAPAGTKPVFILSSQRRACEDEYDRYLAWAEKVRERKEIAEQEKTEKSQATVAITTRVYENPLVFNWKDL